ncbi:Cys/Met metabolism PLP-dependent enzyme-domain-containing protein [Mycena galericulata]|nr:Cys/Met metabolism PLP-dependent enzyme-domain-containing protein [Mycena galericulata]
MPLNLHTAPGFETLQLHGGQQPDPNTKARAVPIFQTAGYVFDDVEHGANLASMKYSSFSQCRRFVNFRRRAPGYLYSRVGNPTVSVLEDRMALLEGGVAAVAASSGQSAITLTISAVAHSGDNIVTASRLYGGTYNLFKTTLQNYGITARFVMSYEVKDFETEIDDKTKAIYVEIITNSDGTLTNIRAMADAIIHSFAMQAYLDVLQLAHQYGIPLIVDSTFAMGGVHAASSNIIFDISVGYIIKPIDHGADIIIHSATKWLGGHGTTLGGILIDSGADQSVSRLAEISIKVCTGRFDWRKSDKFSSMTEPCLSQDGTIFAEKFYPAGLAMFIRAELLRDTGPCLSAMSAFLILQGIETLSLRAQRHRENSMAVAQYLSTHPNIKSVCYLGLSDHPSHQLALKTLRPNCYGGVITFCVDGTLQDTITFLQNLRLASHVANVGDAKTLVILPFVTVQAQLTEDERVSSGVTPGLIRLSVGIESVGDIIGDIKAALRMTF